MVSKRKKKYESGAGSRYVTRKAAMKKLQLTLKDFRKICILKGIYPREPSNRKKAQKGKTGIRTLYHKKDIQFLMHEPMIWRLRDYKIFSQKVGRARALRDFETLKRHLDNHPTLKLDHIVKERYPTFIDALRDIDDCLTLCFMFSTFPSLRHVRRDLSGLCRRLTIEFMHYVIEAKALRKVFISIKGYYYQAEIHGQTITWITPHYFPFKVESKDDVDFRIMATFVDFYTVMLGFTNFKLYSSLNMYYPPKFTRLPNEVDSRFLVDEEVFVSERIAALNAPLSRTSTHSGEPAEEEEVQMDDIPMTDDPQKMMEAKEEREKITKLKTLFKGLFFFINREVPREPLVFIIRCFGGEVSWDTILFVGATFDENDPRITHQIVDRPALSKTFLSRYYVQPQWVFDSVNARKFLPEVDYLAGKTLPPHLSPFTEGRPGQYMPPEEQALRDGVTLPTEDATVEDSDAEVSEEGMSGSDVDEDISSNSEDEDGSDEDDDDDESDGDSDKDSEEEESGDTVRASIAKKKKVDQMAVTTGELPKPDPKQKQREEASLLQLREKMIARKHRKLYRSMMAGRRKRSREAEMLEKKREQIDQQKKDEKRAERKQQRKEAAAKAAVK